MATSGNVKAKSKDKTGIIKFFKEVVAEFKRISWPSKSEIKKASTAVAIFCVFYLVVVSAMDFIFQNLFDLMLNLK